MQRLLILNSECFLRLHMKLLKTVCTLLNFCHSFPLIIIKAGIRKEDVDGSDAAVYVGSFVKGTTKVVFSLKCSDTEASRLRASMPPGP